MLINPHSIKAADGGFTLKPNKTSLTAEEILEVSVTLNAGTNEVSSYITNLTYPEDKLVFEAISTDTSPFSMLLESKGGDGQVNIIKGSTTPLTGDLYIGKVTFKAKSSTSANVVKLSDKSAILTTKNVNILPGSNVQNDAQSTGTSEQSSVALPTWISSLFSSVKNFFSSFFK